MPPSLPPSAPHHQSGSSSSNIITSPRSSPRVPLTYTSPGHAPFASQAFAPLPANPFQHPTANYYSAGSSSPSSWQTQPPYVVHPQSSAAQYLGNGAPTMKSSSSHMHHSLGYGRMAASEPQMPSFQTTPTSFPQQQWVSNTSPTPQWTPQGSASSPHWPSGAMAVGMSSPTQVSGQLSGLLPPTTAHGRSLFSPPGGMLPPSAAAEAGGFPMDSGTPQMPFPDLASRSSGAGSMGQYPSASMVITPKTDGASAALCDPFNVSLTSAFPFSFFSV